MRSGEPPDTLDPATAGGKAPTRAARLHFDAKARQVTPVTVRGVGETRVSVITAIRAMAPRC